VECIWEDIDEVKNKIKKKRKGGIDEIDSY